MSVPQGLEIRKKLLWKYEEIGHFGFSPWSRKTYGVKTKWGIENKFSGYKICKDKWLFADRQTNRSSN